MFWEDKIEGYPVIDDLIKNYYEVKTEIINYINLENILMDYPNYVVDNNKLIYEKYWKATPCSVFNDEYVELKDDEELKNILNFLRIKFKKSCPLTYSIIKSEEDNGYLRNSFISRLLPGSIINTHNGWCSNYLRVHFGIITDPDCKITVNDETKSWEDGKILAFLDEDKHSVVHNGSKERIILSFDVDKERIIQFMPEAKNYV